MVVSELLGLGRPALVLALLAGCHANTDAPKDTDTGVPPDTDTDTDSDSDTDTDSGDTDTDSGDTDTATDSGDTDTDTGPVDTDTDTDPGTTDTDTDPGTTDTDTGPGDTDTDPGTADTDTGPGDTDTDPADPDTDPTPVDTGISPTDSADTGPGASPDDTADSPPTETTDTADTGLPTSPTDTADTAPPVDSGHADTSVETGTPVDTDTGTPVDTDTAAAADSGDTGDSGDTADTGATSTPVRFVALGDAGSGFATQYDVASAIGTVCAANGCDFALYLGDNFYPGGVTSTTDAQWSSKFELPYASLTFPFYAILGNHDYGFGFDVTRAQAQVDYTTSGLSTKWVMEDFYWSEEFGDVSFLAIDTMAIYEGYGADQEAWLPGELAALTGTWKIALGHHPYLSNGPHGNAGDYDGIAGEGVEVQTFFDTYLCGQVDVYLCGHDHSLQWLEPTCGTEFLVSGGGSSASMVGTGVNPSYFEDAATGFLWVEIDGRTLTAVFYDDTATELYRGTITK